MRMSRDELPPDNDAAAAAAVLSCSLPPGGYGHPAPLSGLPALPPSSGSCSLPPTADFRSVPALSAGRASSSGRETDGSARAGGAFPFGPPVVETAADCSSLPAMSGEAGASSADHRHSASPFSSGSCSLPPEPVMSAGCTHRLPIDSLNCDIDNRYLCRFYIK